MRAVSIILGKMTDCRLSYMSGLITDRGFDLQPAARAEAETANVANGTGNPAILSNLRHGGQAQCCRAAHRAA